MNDAYGDPRNFDPNEQEPFDYNNFSSSWGQPPSPQANPVTGGAPSAGGNYAPWTDPDTAPPNLGDPNQQPAGNPGPGNYWAWDGSKWTIRPAPHAQVVPPTGGIDATKFDPLPTTYGGGDKAATGQFDYGRPPGLLPFTPYRGIEPFSYEKFAPSNRDDLYNDQINPGFTKSQDRLRKMIEAGAAYRGVLRSGNTFNDLGSILGNNEEQQFKAFDDRRFRDWSGNLGAAQFGYGQRATENEKQNNFTFNTEKASFDDMLSRWQQLVQSTTQLARPS